MRTLKHKELIEKLMAIKHAMPITISAFTEVKARKTGNPYEKIMKFSIVNGFTGFDYEAAVKRQQIREQDKPTFEASERTWGENLNDVLVTKDGKHYLIIRPLSTKKPLYYAVKNGKMSPVSKKDIQAFLPPDREPNQPINNKIIYRNYNIESLRSICFNGVRYKIV